MAWAIPGTPYSIAGILGLRNFGFRRQLEELETEYRIPVGRDGEQVNSGSAKGMCNGILWQVDIDHVFGDVVRLRNNNPGHKGSARG